MFQSKLRARKRVSLLTWIITKCLSLPIVFLVICSSSCAQSPRSAPPARSVSSLRYDVVSVRPSQSDGGMEWGDSPDGVTIRGATVEQLMFTAYGLRLTDQIAKLPGWAYTKRFDVVAKADASTVETLSKLSGPEWKRQHEKMLQEILSTRFNLKVHVEQRDRPIYLLVCARGGPKLRQSSVPSGRGSSMMSGGRIVYTSATMTDFATSLGSAVGNFVVDKTGLQGRYDIAIHWTDDDGGSRAQSDSSSLSEDAPSIFSALREQLGLELKPGRGPVDMVVVDAVSEPSAN